MHFLAASEAEIVQVRMPMRRSKPDLRRPEGVSADNDYRGTLGTLMQEKFQIPFQISPKIQNRFVVIRGRRVVGRIYASFNAQLRLSED